MVDTERSSPESARGLSVGGRLFAIYQQGKYLSIKHSSYFQVYEQAFERFVGTDVTFVEVGVLNGGSLFMWREYLGPRARIIGIDLNPLAKKWEADGFEIHIGDQSDPQFWAGFFEAVGTVDVLLDDGGHTNAQQITTVVSALPFIRDGGMLMVEDTHASYLPAFGNPTGHSFMNFARRIIDAINARFPQVPDVASDYGAQVFSVTFYESIVVFNVDRRRCIIPQWTSNNGVTSEAVDYRHAAAAVQGAVVGVERNLGSRLGGLRRFSWLVTAKRSVFGWVYRLMNLWRDRKLSRYFR
jgi:hypothetical protein